MQKIPYQWRVYIVKALTWGWIYFGTHFRTALCIAFNVSEVDIDA